MIYFAQQQLQFLLWLKEMRGPFQDGFFLFLNWFDTAYFPLVLISFAWLGFSRQWGIRAFYLTSFALVSTVLAKLAFAIPRPCHLIENLCLYPPTSYGFPSGGAANAMIVGSMLILYCKHRLAWPIAIIYFVLISFSRMYLGVHFPLDVLGGWVLGALIVTLFYYTVEQIEKFARKHLSTMTALSIGLPFLGWVISQDKRIDLVLSSLIAVGLGIFLSRYFRYIPHPPKTLRIGLWRGLIGIATTFVLFFYTDSPFWAYLWISWLGGLMFLHIT